LVSGKGDFIVKVDFVMVMLGLSILLASCSGAGDIAGEPVSKVVDDAPTATVEPTAVIPTNTPEKIETEGSEPVITEATAEPTDTQTPESTPIPCPGVLTSPNQEGPFYSPGSPEKSSLIEEGMPGVPILIFGRVFDQDCNPIPQVKLDFWLADVNGEYDNAGYRLRGHVLTDLEGNYTLESIEPTAYTGRPPHIHVKLFSPNGKQLLTTQMYFAGSEGSGDVSAAPDLLAAYQEPDEAGRQKVIFNFVVQN
jgi:protocatechuate 3,4-dioxygenase beta subunit